jgi:hypothetical protein
MIQDLQRAKISEIADALVESGLRSLDEQAEALGVSRSTAWTIVKIQFKGTGLIAPTINRILASPNLPHSVRIKVIEYAREKVAGRYDHRAARIRRFERKLDRTLLDGSMSSARAHAAI